VGVGFFTTLKNGILNTLVFFIYFPTFLWPYILWGCNPPTKSVPFSTGPCRLPFYRKNTLQPSISLFLAFGGLGRIDIILFFVRRSVCANPLMISQNPDKDYIVFVELIWQSAHLLFPKLLHNPFNCNIFHTPLFFFSCHIK